MWLKEEVEGELRAVACSVAPAPISNLFQRPTPTRDSVLRPRTVSCCPSLLLAPYRPSFLQLCQDDCLSSLFHFSPYCLKRHPKDERTPSSMADTRNEETQPLLAERLPTPVTAAASQSDDGDAGSTKVELLKQNNLRGTAILLQVSIKPLGRGTSRFTPAAALPRMHAYSFVLL